MRKLLVILGIPVDDLTMEEALDRIESFIEIGRRTGKSHQIATANADFVVKALHDPELRHLLQEADMTTADGMPLVWGARLLGVPLQGRVTGADMVPALAKRAADKGYSLYLLGAAPGVADRAAAIMQQHYPQLHIAGTASPPYSTVLEMDSAYIQAIKQAQPDILLVALGNPKQEKWIGMYGRELGVPVMIGVGGTLDFVAGVTLRAPRWMQRCGLEWLYRLVQEPNRLWRRYVVDLLVFGSFFLQQLWRMRYYPRFPLLLPDVDAAIVGDLAILRVQGRLDQSNCAAFMAKAQEALTETPYLMVNLAQATFLDSAAVGMLVALANQARDAEGKLWLTAVPAPIHQTLSFLRLDNFFEIVPDVETGLAAHRARLRKQQEQVQVWDKWLVYSVPRRLDAATAPQMTRQCAAILEHHACVVLDFRDTVFLASAGLAALAQLQRQAAEQGGELRLANCSRDVRRVLEMVRFDRVLALYSDVTSATAAKNAPSAAERQEEVAP